MLSNETRRMIEKEFAEVILYSDQFKSEINERLKELIADEQILMKFMYSSMPVSDTADYDFETYYEFTRHALFLKKNIPWCNEMPDEIFLNYVLFYRVNNEDIQECRKLFYDEIYERIKGKTMAEAALEVNIWCAENVSYRSTDVRTAAPLTVWKAGSGRCGEESTFTVAAMRSVGIPARQIYTPRWSHCDDNHAWVEVWCDGEWHYLGACEPEPVLDRGWFTEAASRAMFIHSRIFSSFVTGEEVVGRQGKTTVLNHIERYADSRLFSVKVADKAGKPVEGAVVRFEVLNQSEFYPVASKITDNLGQTAITLGLGDIHIHVCKDRCLAQCNADTAKQSHIDICLDGAEEYMAQTYKISVPEGDNSRRIQLTPGQNAQRKQVIACADKIREEKIEGLYKAQEADAAVLKYSDREELKAALQKARGNFCEVLEYLKAPVKNDNLELHEKLLLSLTEKDCCDMQSGMLLSHFTGSMPYSAEYEEDVFVKYVMCPRVYFERLTPYREYISGYFDEASKAGFRKDPMLVWKFITDNIGSREDKEYEELFTSPCGVLKAKCGSIISKRILFTAICRTLGIPARMNPVTFLAEYYHAGSFITVEAETENAAGLVINSLDKTEWIFMQNWTLGILDNGVYSTLDLSGLPWQDGVLKAMLPAGMYRLLASNRMPNGGLLAREYYFACTQQDTTEVYLSMPEATVSDLLDSMPFPEVRLSDENGNKYSLSELTAGRPAAVMWLEEGKEPTEHIFNELMEHHREFNKTGCRIIYILRDKAALSNLTLKKTLKYGMNISIYYGDFEEDAVAVSKSLYRDSEKLPLVLVTSDGKHALYSSCGYNVGLADLLVKIINAAG